MEQNTIADSTLWEIFIGHHHALQGLFYKYVIIRNDSLYVESNVENDKNWEYLGYINSFQGETSEAPNIYTNQEIPSKNYNLIYTDVWLLNNLSSVDPKINSAELEVIEVKNLEDITIFADLFLEAYSLETDPYGKFDPIYKTCIINSFLSKTAPQVKFYYALYKGMPCATFALSFASNICYSYCLGVIPQYRGLGISHFIHRYQNFEAAKNKARFHVLQTISTSYIEDIAKKHGFVSIGQFGLYKNI